MRQLRGCVDVLYTDRESRRPCHTYHEQDITKQYGRLCALCEQDYRTEEWEVMTQEEQDSHGEDYTAISRITRDIKTTNKGWKWAATSTQLGQAHLQVVSELQDANYDSVFDSQDTTDPKSLATADQQLPRSNRTAKRRKSNSYGHVIIDRAKTLAHTATDAEQDKAVVARRLDWEAEEQAIPQESRQNLTEGTTTAAPRADPEASGPALLRWWD